MQLQLWGKVDREQLLVSHQLWGKDDREQLLVSHQLWGKVDREQLLVSHQQVGHSASDFLTSVFAALQSALTQFDVVSPRIQDILNR